MSSHCNANGKKSPQLNRQTPAGRRIVDLVEKIAGEDKAQLDTWSVHDKELMEMFRPKDLVLMVGNVNALPSFTHQFGGLEDGS
jgi:hypothetical protein